MNVPGYNSHKAAHVAAFFSLMAGGRIEILKLVKLIYLSDREHLNLYDTPILYDNFVSMPHGPVNSNTLDNINGFNDDAEWSATFKDKANHFIALQDQNLNVQDLKQLSRAEIRVLENIWSDFGHMSKYQIRDYTHSDACPEWEDPKGGSTPLTYERIFEVLGKADPKMLENAILEERSLSAIWDH